MSEYNRPRKNPYDIIAVRATMDGRTVRIIHDYDEDIYWVGINLTLENLHEGGPYGCRTCYDKEDARAEMEDMI